MTTITQVSTAMHYVLKEVADRAGRESGFIKRERKLSGVSFVQTLVFGWAANPQGSLEELSWAAATFGVEIRPQGLEMRFSPSAAECLKQVLEASLSCLVEADGGSIGLLGRFRSVYLQDSTEPRSSASTGWDEQEHSLHLSDWLAQHAEPRNSTKAYI